MLRVEDYTKELFREFRFTGCVGPFITIIFGSWLMNVEKKWAKTKNNVGLTLCRDRYAHVITMAEGKPAPQKPNAAALSAQVRNMPLDEPRST